MTLQATFAPHQYQTPAAQQYAAQPQPAQAAQPAQPAAATTQQAAPSINPQTGQPDYSAQWAEYYRYGGTCSVPLLFGKKPFRVILIFIHSKLLLLKNFFLPTNLLFLEMDIFKIVYLFH